MLDLIGRNKELFTDDIQNHKEELEQIVSSSRFLVIGGAGSIGQAVTKEIFKRNPLKLHVVDISENNMVELVRDIRSSFGYMMAIFKPLLWMWVPLNTMPFGKRMDIMIMFLTSLPLNMCVAKKIPLRSCV